MMATSPVTDEDEVEFVSEGPLRPVLEYIDLLSDGENEDFPVHRTVEDQVDRQKAKVASTLDRLAHQVATEKQERAEKCRAFKEKIVSQQAHGRQELAFNASSGETRSAKHCVDMWLKMPGPKPGAVHTGWMKRRPAAPPDGSRRPSTHTCPVVNCGRTFDGVPLLEGHLKRFDHSPCDPAVTLRGGPSEIYACVACGKSFQTKEAWQNHYRSKHSSPSHGSGLSFQLIQCFACPCCCLLFNLRDQCLQHMAARNHISHAIILSEKTPQAAMPIPVPRYAQNQLIALCKEVPFCVRCSSCRRTLSSHMEARAHFSVQCRQGGAVAEAAQTVPEVLRRLCAFGRCSRCRRTFPSEADAAAHQSQTQHRVSAFRTVPEALLHYCHLHQQGAPSGPAKRQEAGRDAEESPAKRRRQGGGGGATAWACECGLSFPEEAAARRHLLAANQIFHRCGVCGKEMGEAAIARLHMSRFHGGAHLSNFLFRCRRCGTDAPREEDVLAHVRDAHAGHTFYREREAPPAPAPPPSLAKAAPAKPPSLAKAEPAKPPSSPADAAPTEPAGPSGGGRGRGRGQGRSWLCRMCEDVFGSEAEVRAHCGDVGAHSFHKFLCGECGQRFFKAPTLARHCQLQHAGRSDPRRFCGLCDGMQLDSEEDFLRHYRSLHARDYCRLEEEEEEAEEEQEEEEEEAAEEEQEEAAGPGETGPSLAGAPGLSAELLCPCMGAEEGGADQKAAFTHCMRRLAGEGLCSYACPPCGLRTPHYLLAKEHARRRHGSPGKRVRVLCGSCPESAADVPSFHSHFHARHCPLEPCASLRGPDAGDGLRVLKAEEVSLETKAEEFEEVKRAVALSAEEPGRGAEESGRGAEETGRGAEGDSEECDEDLKRALALSAEEAQEQAEGEREMEEALQRSLLEF
ncbi:E3 SUMO-protein ligase ZNF451 isoform X2 [Anguilla rostrata]|uniref:E3 SUMO-protein ligase ZNF451 isoform X2 n=1 Tax=Anguilla rostrata TaxID=7938 RepID=UPI0030CE7117